MSVCQLHCDANIIRLCSWLCRAIVLVFSVQLLWSMLHCCIILRCNGHFPGGPELAGTSQYVYFLDFIGVKGDGLASTTGAIRYAKLQSNCHHRQTNTQLFLQAGCHSVAQPPVSKHKCRFITVSSSAPWDCCVTRLIGRAYGLP